MKKAFRDLKKGVNKKVLKVPGIEQKVLDATSNESWGPHGSLLADIAHASRNYHEYQLTMGVLWKRLSDTGKNWRHVYKALIVLEYMVGHGSERVIEEIKERAYQISTLSGFQYIDSSGRDQGSNVRKKSQSLVALVNDKDRIAEVREKAAANIDKYHNSSVGGMHRDKYNYEGRYGDRDEGRSSYGREREYGYRDDDKTSRDGDCYSRDSEDRYGRDGNRDDENRGRSRSVDSRGRSSERERSVEDDGQSPSRGSGTRADNNSQDGRGGLERKSSEPNIGAAPPSYEEAVSESRSPVYSEMDGGETPQVAPTGAAGASPPAEVSSVDHKAAGVVNESPPQQFEAFDEFDPRGSSSAISAPTPGASAPAPSPSSGVSTSAPPTSNDAEMDLLGSFSDVLSPTPLAIVTSDCTSVETSGQANTGPAPSFSTSQSSNQHFEDPFGDSPFKAITSYDTDPSQHQSFGASFQPTQPTSNFDNGHKFGFAEEFSAVPNPELGVQNMQAPPNSSILPQEQFDASQSEIDILAGILPPSGPPVSMSPQPNSTLPTSQLPPSGNIYESFHPHTAPTDPNMPEQTPFGQASHQYNMVTHSQNHSGGMQFNNGGVMQQTGHAGSSNSQPPQCTPGLSSHPTSESFPHQPSSATSSSSHAPYPTTPNAPSGQFDGGNFMTEHTQSVTQVHGVASHVPPQRTQSGPPAAYDYNNNDVRDMFAPAGPSSSGALTSQPSLTPITGAIEIANPQSQKKFEPKSTIWADTLSRGLVNFNISGPKTNPLSDIGVDFDAINRKEKRLEKPSTTQQQVISTINMGKAMGSGTGLGRAGAGAMRPPTNSMVGSSMPTSMNVGGYGGGGMNPNHPMGIHQNHSMGGMNQNHSMGGMNQNYPMGMNQNHPMGMNQNQSMGMNQNQSMGMNQNHHMGMNQNHPMGMNQNQSMGMNQNHNMNQNQSMGMNQNQSMGMNQNHNMGMNQNHNMGMNQNHPMGMNQNQSMVMNQSQIMGMGMNMGGYGQGYPMQPQHGMTMAPPGQPQGMMGAYNLMMSQGGYNPQQQPPYGGGYG